MGKHDNFKFDEIMNGLYVKGSGFDAYCTPCIPQDQVSQNVINALLSENFADLGEARKILDSILAAGKDVKEVSDLGSILRAPPPRFSTPVKREPADLNLRAKFDTILKNVLDDKRNAADGDNELEKARLFNEYLVELTSTVESNQYEMDQLAERVFDTTSQLGVAPKNGPPTLWVGHMEIKSDLEEISNSLKRKADLDAVSTIKDVEVKLEDLDREHKKLKRDIATSFQDVATEIYSVSKAGVHHAEDHAMNPGLSETINKLNQEMGLIKKFVDNEGSKGVAGKLSIQIGKFRFNSMEDVGAWSYKCLPPNYPFGPFIDVYSFLERVKSAKDISEFNSAVGEMDTRRKASLSADEAIIVEAFQHPLPRCFRGSSSSANIGAWLPGLKTKDSWENKSSTRGVKLAIRDNMDGIRQRIEAIISTRLNNHPEAADLARVLLSDTITFITTLSAYITGTQTELTSAGFPEDDAWNLVSKLIYRIFATDCYHE